MATADDHVSFSRRAHRTPSSVDEPTIVADDGSVGSGPSHGGQDSSPHVLHEVIGHGGLSLVHRGWQRSLEREVAIKVARGDRLVAHHSAGKALCAEARIAAQLDHPGVLPMHDLQWLDEQTPMLVMRRIQGETWSDRRESLSRQEHAAILMQVAQVIRYAHDQGIVHRDLKPANVLLGAYGEVLVIDWGMAVQRGDYADDSRPWPPGVSGTPQYLAPEAARQERPGPALDIYGLGALLFVALCGTPPHPFVAVDQALDHARAGLIAEHPDPQSDELLQVAVRAMAPLPQDRYPDAESFCQALREAMSHEDARRLLLEAAEDCRAAKLSSHPYQDYQRALFRYQEAQQLWPSNPAIAAALQEAGESFVRCAVQHGDLDLAASILDGLAAPAPDLGAAVRQAQAMREDLERETERVQNRTLWMQSFLLDVLSQSGHDKQGPEVTLIQALQHCSRAMRERSQIAPEDRIDVRLAVLQAMSEPHLVELRQLLMDDIEADMQRLDMQRFSRPWQMEIVHARMGILMDRGWYQAALPLVREFWEFVVEEKGSEDFGTVVLAYDKLITCLLYSGEAQASAQLLNEYLVRMEASAGQMSPEQRLMYYRNLFGCMVRCGELQQAEQLGRSLLQEECSPLSGDRHGLLMNLVFLYIDQGRWREAQDHIAEAHAWRSRRFGAQATPTLHLAVMQHYVHGLLGDVSAHHRAAAAYQQLRDCPDSNPFNCLEARCRVARLQQLAGAVDTAAKTLADISADLDAGNDSEDATWLAMLVDLVWARQYVCLDDPGPALTKAMDATTGLDQHFGPYDGRARRSRAILADIAVWAEQTHPRHYQEWRSACGPEQLTLLDQGHKDRRQYPGLALA